MKKTACRRFRLVDWQAEFMRIHTAFGWLAGFTPGMLLWRCGYLISQLSMT